MHNEDFCDIVSTYILAGVINYLSYAGLGDSVIVYPHSGYQLSVNGWVDNCVLLPTKSALFSPHCGQ